MKVNRDLFTLSFFTIFFTAITLVVVWFRPDDGQLYQSFYGLLAGFAGALLRDMIGTDKVPPPGSVTTTKVDQVTKTPPIPTDPSVKPQ
jgi:hypothetical protein